MNWKDFFYFSKRERRGIFFLVVLITGIFLGKWLFTPKELPPIEKLEISDKQEIISYKQKTYSASSADPYRPNSPSPTRSPEKHTYYHKEEIPKPTVYSKTEKLSSGETVELNSCDTAQLMKIPSIGSSFAKRIVSYRNLLGGYTRVDQLQEVYGMYEELYS
ncbi:MAG: helix-hairpin-helix domain-containing protein, partial [Dysgonamonadaceae bacterium]|nr:helix-hairpin-helix domain-containing protein [Dysgonamonadaceae bacterium]